MWRAGGKWTVPEAALKNRLHWPTCTWPKHDLVNSSNLPLILGFDRRPSLLLELEPFIVIERPCTKESVLGLDFNNRHECKPRAGRRKTKETALLHNYLDLFMIAVAGQLAWRGICCKCMLAAAHPSIPEPCPPLRPISLPSSGGAHDRLCIALYRTTLAGCHQGILSPPIHCSLHAYHWRKRRADSAALEKGRVLLAATITYSLVPVGTLFLQPCNHATTTATTPPCSTDCHPALTWPVCTS